jgi:hypothetical protein
MRKVIIVIGIMSAAILLLAFAQGDAEVFALLHQGLNLDLFVQFSLALLGLFLVVLGGIYAASYFWRRSSASRRTDHFHEFPWLKN